jgi:hypothetical protein
MFGFNRFALLSPEGDVGGGAPEGESPEGEGKDVIPKTQFLAALKSAEEKRERELAALRGEFEAKLAEATKPKAEAPKFYTKAQLDAAVEAGQISRDDADAQLQLQADERARAIARETVQQGLRTSSVSSQIDQYSALIPDVMVAGSDERGKVQAEYNFLVGLGDKPGLETQLKALRAAYGPIEAVRAAKSGRPSHESHVETPGGGGGGGPGPKGGGLKLTARQREHYGPRVGPGKLYPDWKAVEAELGYATARRNTGAPA